MADRCAISRASRSFIPSSCTAWLCRSAPSTPLNSEYLKKLKALADWLKPAWISDHLCWTGIAHRNTHDLLPIPYTDEALKHVVARIREVQDFLGRPIALENPSTYLEFQSSHMPEAEFIARMAEESGCHLLLDVNNVYVNCYNHGLDPVSYIDTLRSIACCRSISPATVTTAPTSSIRMTTTWPMRSGRCTATSLARAGRIPNTMIEWDDRIPDFPVLLAEMDKAKAIAAKVNRPSSLPDSITPQARYQVTAIPGLETEQSGCRRRSFMTVGTTRRSGYGPRARSLPRIGWRSTPTPIVTV